MAVQQAPDFESYAFTKLDATNPADQEFVNDTWAWDKPVTIDGKVCNLLCRILHRSWTKLIPDRPTSLPTERFSNKPLL